MTQSKTTLGAIAIIALAGLLAFYLVITTRDTQGSAPGGMETVYATSSTIDATNAARVAFASSTCTSRVITVPAGGGVMIKFSDHAEWTLSATVGHMQAASTTVTYDAGTHGCGQWTVWGTGDLQVSEFRGFR